MLIINHTTPLSSTSLSTIIFLYTTQQSGMFLFGASTGLPIKIIFNGGQNHSSETHTVSKSIIFVKVNIQIQKTSVQWQSPERRYVIYVTVYKVRSTIFSPSSWVLYFSGNLCSLKLNKTQTKRDNTMGVQYFYVYQQVLPTSSYHLSSPHFTYSQFDPTSIFASTIIRVRFPFGMGGPPCSPLTVL